MDAELCQINANDYASNLWENLRESEIFEQDDEDRGSADPVVVEDTGTPPPWVVVSVKKLKQRLLPGDGGSGQSWPQAFLGFPP